MTGSANGGRGLCYVVLIFNDVTPLFVGLWSTWDVRNTYILVVDEKSSSACKSLCEMLSDCFENVTCLRGHNGSWGGYSLVLATLSGIQTALRCSSNWHHLFVISGNHVALQDQDRIHSCLTLGRSYLISEYIPRVSRPSDAEFLTMNGNHQRLWGRWEEVPGIRMIMTGIRSQLPDVHFFKGSQWIALSRTTCEALSEARAVELSNFFAHTFVADEAYFHTTVRAIEPRENIDWIGTTYHGWHGGRATCILESEYEAAAHNGWWFGRKLPKTIPRGYIDVIRRHCRASDLDSFADLVNASSSRGSTIAFNDGSLTVTTRGERDNYGALLRSNHEKLIRALRKFAGSDAVVGQYGGDVLDVRIEPPAIAAGLSPVIGVVRSRDGKTAWLTIQLRAELFSDRLASLLLSSDQLRSVIDRVFEETYLEPQFREFFQRKFRTAFILAIDRIQSVESDSRLAIFFKLLAEAWACIDSPSSFDNSAAVRHSVRKSSKTRHVKKSPRIGEGYDGDDNAPSEKSD